MPIRINLLAEEQAAEEMRRKDPVKRTIWVASFAVFLVLLWGVTLFLKTIITRSELAGLEGRWKSMEKAVKQVEDGRKQTLDTEHKLAALGQFTTNRFLWANALDALQFATVDKVQLLRLKSEQFYIQNEAGKAATNVTGAAAAKTVSATERIVLYLDGKDFSPRAAEQVPRFKEVLAESSYFQSVLQKTNSVLLTSLSAPQTDEERGLSFVVFGLQLNLQEKERRAYE